MQRTLKSIQVIGQVVKRNDHWNAVQVRVPQMKLDEFLLMYFNDNSELWASSKDVTCKEGDMVMIKTMTQPQSVDVRHEVIKLLYPIGATIDPVTNTRCRGVNFVNDDLISEAIKEHKITSL